MTVGVERGPQATQAKLDNPERVAQVALALPGAPVALAPEAEQQARERAAPLATLAAVASPAAVASRAVAVSPVAAANPRAAQPA